MARRCLAIYGGKEVYAEAGFFVQMLVDKFGKEKLLHLIKDAKNYKTPESFADFFAKEYGFKLAYKDVNYLISNNA